MKQYVLFLFVSIVLVHTARGIERKKSSPILKASSTKTSQVSEITIDGPAMVSISAPEGTKVDEIGDDAVGSDIGHYLHGAHLLAQKNDLKEVNTNVRRIIFKKKDGSVTVIKNTVADLMGKIYFFDGAKAPQEVQDITGISNEYAAYFGKAPK